MRLNWTAPFRFIQQLQWNSCYIICATLTCRRKDMFLGVAYIILLRYTTSIFVRMFCSNFPCLELSFFVFVFAENESNCQKRTSYTRKHWALWGWKCKHNLGKSLCSIHLTWEEVGQQRESEFLLDLTVTCRWAENYGLWCQVKLSQRIIAEVGGTVSANN